jgi:hypothetical protein
MLKLGNFKIQLASNGNWRTLDCKGLLMEYSFAFWRFTKLEGNKLRRGWQLVAGLLMVTYCKEELIDGPDDGDNNDDNPNPPNGGGGGGNAVPLVLPAVGEDGLDAIYPPKELQYAA